MFTVQDLISEVTRLAEASPDNVYRPEVKDPQVRIKGCRYTSGGNSNGSCGCIFGQAMINLGVDPEFLQHCDNWSDYGLGVVHVIPKLMRIHIDMDTKPKEVSWCIRAQCAQDNGDTWKESINAANEFMGDIA